MDARSVILERGVACAMVSLRAICPRSLTVQVSCCEVVWWRLPVFPSDTFKVNVYTPAVVGEPETNASPLVEVLRLVPGGSDPGEMLH